MGRLSVDQVNQSSSSLIARASSAIDTLESRKSYFGNLTGNNDTVSQTQGALTMIRDVQIPKWRDNGIEIATSEDDSKVDGWLAVGGAFSQAITDIDGYGEDATLQAVARQTIVQSTQDVANKVLPALSFGFGSVAAIALIGLGLYIFFLTKRVS